MNAPIFLDNETRDHLVWVIESSLQVRSQSGFFLWSTGALQTLVPHDMLICGAANSSRQGFELRWFASTRRFREDYIQAACDPKGGLISKLMSEWAKTEAPCFLFPEFLDAGMAETLCRYELGNVVAHGVRGNDGGLAGFFCFSHARLENSVRNVRVLEMITPFVNFTFTRMLVEEARNKSAVRRNGAARSALLPAESLVTAREIEILHWIKEGKSTQDIARVLELSPFTVKNHVQRILRKLQVKSRSHAIAQAISRGLFRDGT